MCIRDRLQAVRKLDNVQILEHVAMTDILTDERDGATAVSYTHLDVYKRQS